MDSDVEKIASSYVQAAGGNSDKALRLAISDALADLTEAERNAQGGTSNLMGICARADWASEGDRGS